MCGKMASARGRAEAIGVFPFQLARQGSGYPSSGLIEPGKSGKVCTIVDKAVDKRPIG